MGRILCDDDDGLRRLAPPLSGEKLTQLHGGITLQEGDLYTTVVGSRKFSDCCCNKIAARSSLYLYVCMGKVVE